MTVEHTRLALHRALRRHIEEVAAQALAERQHHRTRKRTRGDRSGCFWDDDDRFALALMAMIRTPSGYELMRFGSGRSNHAAARHAAALMAPGRGQRVAYTHRLVDGVFRARPGFKAGSERHDMAARRLTRKQRQLQGVAANWVCMSATMLRILNSPVSGAGRTHARLMLGLLGWRDLPPAVFERWERLIIPSNINGLSDVMFSDEPGPTADDYDRPRLTAGDRHRRMKPTSAALLNTIEAARARLGCGRTKVWELARAGDLEAVKLGRRTLITEASLQHLVSRLPRVGSTAPGTR